MNIVERRATCLKAMNEFIIELGDEIIYDSWIMVVPDEATESDFMDIANDVPYYSYVCEVYYDLIAYDEKHNY